MYSISAYIGGFSSGNNGNNYSNEFEVAFPRSSSWDIAFDEVNQISWVCTIFTYVSIFNQRLFLYLLILLLI